MKPISLGICLISLSLHVPLFKSGPFRKTFHQFKMVLTKKVSEWELWWLSILHFTEKHKYLEHFYYHKKWIIFMRAPIYGSTFNLPSHRWKGCQTVRVNKLNWFNCFLLVEAKPCRATATRTMSKNWILLI